MRVFGSDKHRLRAAQTELCGGLLVPPFECPERVDYIEAELANRGFLSPVEPTDFGLEPIRRIHEDGFLTFLQTCWNDWVEEGFEGEAIATTWPSRRMTLSRPPRNIDGKIGYYCLASETSISEGTWEAAYWAAQVALSGAKAIQDDDPAAFALCRPPGHHAAQDMFGGYCFLNNAAIAAQFLLDQGAKRVAILDVDFHHGNGTQAIFYDRADVLFLSLHGDPDDAFPFFLGAATETGEGAGEGFTVNYPLPIACPYSAWKAALVDALERIAGYAPDALVVSLGVDTFEKDPISFFKLKSADFTDYGGLIAGLGLPTLFVMEGGYAVAEIGVNTVNVLEGFSQSLARQRT